MWSSLLENFRQWEKKQALRRKIFEVIVCQSLVLAIYKEFYASMREILPDLKEIGRLRREIWIEKLKRKRG